MAGSSLQWRLQRKCAKLQCHAPDLTKNTFVVVSVLSALVVLLLADGNGFPQQHQHDRVPIPGSSIGNSSQMFPRASKNPTKFCFNDGRATCTCRWQVANCSHNDGRLEYLPRIRGRTYDFSFNKLRSIPSDSFLKNVSVVSILDLSHNDLAYIHPAAFRVFKFLRQLQLNGNDLTYAEISHVFPLPGLLHLQIGSMKLGPIPGDFFQNDSAPLLNTLDVNMSTIGHLDFSAFGNLTKLKFLYAKGCKLTDNMITTTRNSKLRGINLAENAMYDLPQTCDQDKRTSLFPKLHTLVLLGNSLSNLPSNYCLPQLRTLDLSSTRITRFTTDMFNNVGFPNLTRLALNSIQPISMIENFAFRHPRLKMLFMDYCVLSFNKIQNQSFAGAPRLFYLHLSHSQAPENPGEMFAEIFGSIPHLEYLFLARAGIRTITRNTFSRFSKLTRLYLDRNKLTDLPDGAFDDLRRLKELVLSSNELNTVRESAFSLRTRKRLRKLDLSGNKFSCDCDILWFQRFLLTSPRLFNGSYNTYSCNNDPHFPLSSFVLNEQACLFSQNTYKYIIASVSMLMILGTMTSLVFQYRWHIRLLLYEAYKGRDAAARYRRLQEGNFIYDVYVSYASEDLYWLRDHLLPELEDRLGLRLCIHDRDFLIGQNTADSIVYSVQRSKKILMLFSRNFVTNQWCQFELAYCQRHVMDHDDALIVTCLGEMTSLRATGAMLAELKTTTCIQWENSPQAVASFWGRVELALIDVLPDNGL